MFRKNNPLNKLRQHPILILLVINLVLGLMTFRSYGLSWDEPLFYDYGAALRYAYTPANWFRADFNLENSFGSSGTDHANRGPAYLLIASPFVSLLEQIGLDLASAWHLVNFLTFQLGIYLLYRLASKWTRRESALAAAALFSWQPLLWGHAFINPKDIPFLTFFLGAVCFGFEMVDAWIQEQKLPVNKILLASIFLGITTSIRVLGPLAGLLTGLYAITYWKKIQLGSLLIIFAIYAGLTILFTFITWPYLWLNPIQKFVEVFGFMSDNPTQLNVLFAGSNYQAGELPHRYFPLLLGYTLSEPVYILTVLGLLFGFWKSDTKKWLELSVLSFWFGVLLLYILVKRPAMYDGYRHFLFILPPLFIFSGIAFDRLFEWLQAAVWKITVSLAILAFGILPIVQLHPYQYAYYNNFASGVGGAFREYETEFWLTCYREAVLDFNKIAPDDAQLFVRREPYIAAYYADPKITIRDFRTEQKNMKPGDYYLANSRSNEDLRFLRDEPAVVEISRLGATFCVIKQVP